MPTPRKAIQMGLAPKPPYSPLRDAVRSNEAEIAGEEGLPSRGTVPIRSVERNRTTRAVALLAAGFFVVVCAACAAYRAGWAAGTSQRTDSVQLAAVGKCHMAVKGEPCYQDVMFAKMKYLKGHPDWYPGLNVDSSFKEIQNFLNKQVNADGLPRCPKPCGFVEKNDNPKLAKGECHNARGGEECYTHVMYTSKQIPEHPDWYVGLTVKSTFTEVQEYLSKQTSEQGPVCPPPCGRPNVQDVQNTTGPCRTAVKGEACYDAVKWVSSIGYKTHPEWFKGITAETSPEDVQNYLSKNKGSHCELPACPCHTSLSGEECYIHVAFTMKEIPEHPSWYPGLTANSSFKEVQAYMAEETTAEGKKVCPVPCGLVRDEVENELVQNHTCHTARAGEPCYDQVLYAMEEVTVHPEWYQGLDNESTFEAFQELLHRGKEDGEGKRCPTPCNLQAVKSVSEKATGYCHTALKGEPCWDDVLGIHNEVLQKHPDKFPGLSLKSTFEEIQLNISNISGSHCDHRPCPCHTTVEGEECYRHVMWVKRDGIEKHPNRYSGLSTDSTIEEVQYRLHQDRTQHCLLPCTPSWDKLVAVKKTQEAMV